MHRKQVTAPSKVASGLEIGRKSRREWLISLFSIGVVGAGPLVLSEPGNAFEPAASGGEIASFRVRSVLELNGEVRLKNQGVAVERKQGKQLVARTAPVVSTTTLDYDEQYRIGRGERVDSCVQFFHEANSEITVDRNITKTTLRENAREIVKLASPAGLVTASPSNPLFAAERELVDGSLTTMFIDQILTDKEVSVGDKWNVESAVTARLFNLDGVQDGKLSVCLVDVDDTQAQLAIEGRLTASVRDVATEMQVEGKGVMDRKGGYVSWLALRIVETREIGEAEPGFEVTATMRLLRAPIEGLSSGRTLAQALKEVPSLSAASMLQFQSDHGYYRFLADRRWSTYRDNGEEATLRFIVNNRRIAQCNVANLVDFEAGRQLSLDGFQSDVKRLISKGGNEILEASEKISSASHRLLRIVVGGSVEGVPIRWIYYHISNDSGRRLTMTFTLDEDSLEAFAEQDHQLTDTLELLTWPSKLDPKLLESPEAAEVTDSAVEMDSQRASEKSAASPQSTNRKR